MNQNPREQVFLLQIKKYTIKRNLAICYLHNKTKLVAGIFLDFDWQQVDTKEVNLTEELQRQDIFTENRPSARQRKREIFCIVSSPIVSNLCGPAKNKNQRNLLTPKPDTK